MNQKVLWENFTDISCFIAVCPKCYQSFFLGNRTV